jgi:hypothetical protein
MAGVTYRKLRVAWSVGWGVLCLLLVVLWLLSYFYVAGAHRSTPSGPGRVRTTVFMSEKGCLIVMKYPPPRGTPSTWWQLWGSTPAKVEALGYLQPSTLNLTNSFRDANYRLRGSRMPTRFMPAFLIGRWSSFAAGWHCCLGFAPASAFARCSSGWRRLR